MIPELYAHPDPAAAGVTGCILGIESSCDETAAAVLINGKLVSQVVASQEIHAQYGGVVPELASRAHQEAVLPVVMAALEQAGITTKDLTSVAVTCGPGLLGALLVGTSFAKGLAQALDIPLMGVNHMQAHVLAHFLSDPAPSFPFLCLTVSGGHTQLVLVRTALDFEVLGQTEDDAVGEAFDKGAKLLGLPYPGGPMLDKLAATGNPTAFAFPVSRRPGFSFTFSGIKTALLTFLQKHEPVWVQENLADIAASYQHALVQMLIIKAEEALVHTEVAHVALAGGVAANSGLRKAMSALAEKHGVQLWVPPLAHCTDNAAMVAMAGYFLAAAGQDHRHTLSTNPSLAL